MRTMKKQQKANENVIWFHFPSELYYKLEKMPYLRQGSVYDIRDIIQVIFDNVVDSRYKMSKEKLNKLIQYIVKVNNYNYSFVSKEEKDLRFLVIEYLINLVCNIQAVEDDNYLIAMIDSKEGIIKRFEELKEKDRYNDLYNWHSEEADEANRILHQVGVKAGYSNWKEIYDEEGNPIVPEAEQQKQSKKEAGTDKRIKKTTIHVLDGDTRELIKEYTTREDIISEYGISKSRLSECITSCKDPNWQYWNRWKDKLTGKRYYFKEKVYKKS